MRILVTGGAGYLGSVLVPSLVGLGHSVVVYDNLLYDDEYRYHHPYVQFVLGDVTDTENILQYVDANSIDAIVWLAGIVGDAACMVNPVRAVAVNRDSVKVLGNYPGPVIFASSCSVYGISGGIATEESETAPLSLYAETKLDAERILLEREYPTLILRFGTLHGVSGRMRYDLVVNTMTRDAHARGEINVFGGHQSRPLASVNDVANIIGVCLYPEYWDSGIYNLASENLTILGIAQEVAAYIDGTRICENASNHEDRRNYAVDNTKLVKMLDQRTHIGTCFHHPVYSSIQEVCALLDTGYAKNPYADRYNNALMLKKGSN